MNQAINKLSSVRNKLQNENKILNSKIESALKHKDEIVRELNNNDTHNILVKQIDHLHIELKESRKEHQQLKEKAQLHYMRRKEEWKKLKQFKKNIINEIELNKLCKSICDIINKLGGNINIIQINEINDITQFIQNILISLTSLNINISSQIDQYKIKLKENDKLIQSERLNWRQKLKSNNIEYSQLSDKFKIIEQENNNLRLQIVQLNNDIQELEQENSNLREEKRKSLEGNTNNQYLSEKINFQKQLRILREERDIAEKKLKDNETKYKQLSLQIHQIQLQFESSQQKVNDLENDKMKFKQQLNTNKELISTLEAEKTSLSKKK